MTTEDTTSTATEDTASDITTDVAADTDTDAPAEDRQSKRDAEFRERAVAAETRAARLASHEVERLLGQHVTSPADALALAQIDPADFLDDNDDVDEAALLVFVNEVCETRPWLRKAPSHHGDLGAVRTSVKARPRTSWGTAFRQQP